MKKSDRHFLVMCAAACLCAFVSAGCATRMTSEEYDKWQLLMERQEKLYRQDIASAEKEFEATQLEEVARTEECNFLAGKVEALEKENEILLQRWQESRTESRKAFANVLTQFEEQPELFFNVMLGDGTRKMNNQWRSAAPTVLLETEARIPVDCQIQAVEVYSGQGPVNDSSNCFYVALFAKDARGRYVVKELSEKLKIYCLKNNRFSFMHAPLHASKGDIYGLILMPNTSIDYERLDLGKIEVVKLNDFKGNAGVSFAATGKVAMRGNTQKTGSCSFAFSLLGTSVNKHSFVIDKKAISTTHEIESLEIACKPSSQGKTLEGVFFRLAVLRLNKETKRYAIVELSERMVMLDVESQKVMPRINGVEKMKVMPGDMCALVFSPGLQGQQVTCDQAKMSLIEMPFDPLKPFCSLGTMEMIKTNSKTVDEDGCLVDFSVRF